MQSLAPVEEEAGQLESCFAKKALWVLVDTKLTMSQQCTIMAKASDTFGSARKSVDSRLREVVLSPLLSADDATSVVVCPVLRFPLHGTWTYWSKSNEKLATSLRGRNICHTKRG